MRHAILSARLHHMKPPFLPSPDLCPLYSGCICDQKYDPNGPRFMRSCDPSQDWHGFESPAAMGFGSSPEADPRRRRHQHHQDQRHPHQRAVDGRHSGQSCHRGEPRFSPQLPHTSPTADEIEQLKDHCDSIGREIRRYDKAGRSDEAVPARAGSGLFKSQAVIETIATVVHEDGLPDRVKHLALEIFERSCQRLLKQGRMSKLDMLQDVLVATSLASKWINSSKNLKCAVQVRLMQLHSHRWASKASVLVRELQMFETLDYSIPPSIHCTIESLVTILAANAEVQQIDIEREALDRLVDPLLMVTAVSLPAPTANPTAKPEYLSLPTLQRAPQTTPLPKKLPPKKRGGGGGWCGGTLMNNRCWHFAARSPCRPYFALFDPPEPSFQLQPPPPCVCCRQPASHRLMHSTANPRDRPCCFAGPRKDAAGQGRHPGRVHAAVLRHRLRGVQSHQQRHWRRGRGHSKCRQPRSAGRHRGLRRRNPGPRQPRAHVSSPRGRF